MLKLFLDDERFPIGNGWAIVRSVAEAIAWSEAHGMPQFVSFDNDLGPGQPEGRAFADLPAGFDFYVHSQNPVAREAIEGKLRAYLEFRRKP